MRDLGKFLNYRPLYPETADQGDPYMLVVPDMITARYRYYFYVTGDLASGLVFPVYASDDLFTWHALGSTLVADSTPRAYWAPCVRYIPGLQRPFVMLYSRSVGIGEHAHIGHVIRRADSKRPEGPFVDSGNVLTPDTDFAIDPDVYRTSDGVLRLAYATDFVADVPYGTGIVETAITEDLTSVLTAPRILARPSEPWHIYDVERRMPWKQIDGIDWATDIVAWHTIEAPVGGLVNPRGRSVYLYSGGCYFGFYASGALVENEAGTLVNVSRDGLNFVLRPDPRAGPGHCMPFRTHSGQEYIIAHVRYGSPKAPRNAMIAELLWDETGSPYCPSPG